MQIRFFLKNAWVAINHHQKLLHKYMAKCSYVQQKFLLDGSSSCHFKHTVVLLHIHPQLLQTWHKTHSLNRRMNGTPTYTWNITFQSVLSAVQSDCQISVTETKGTCLSLLFSEGALWLWSIRGVKVHPLDNWLPMNTQKWTNWTRRPLPVLHSYVPIVTSVQCQTGMLGHRTVLFLIAPFVGEMINAYLKKLAKKSMLEYHLIQS